LRYLVTGCAGFIGSHLTDRLLSDGHVVVGYDNFSSGRLQFLEKAFQSRNFTLVRGDTQDLAKLADSLRAVDFVFHLAANADVRHGVANPRKDLEQNTVATSVVLQAMRQSGVDKIAFASSGSVYGDSAMIPTPEDAPCPVQTSFYGASKMAGEGLISAYCSGFGFRASIFRFASILGERYTHGHVFDFCKQLRSDPGKLRVLGNGRQRKSYLYVHDCIDAMFRAIDHSEERVGIFNLASEDYCVLDDSIAWICASLQLTPAVEYGGGDRGWVGDNPFLFLDTAKIRATGWRPKVSVREGVVKTVEYLRANPELFGARP
jgi:UDP-glucose 4-epimerase